MTVPEVIAPTAVTLSDASRTVQADAALPITLATVTADGDTPMLSLTAGAPWFALVGDELRLTQMPAEGSHSAAVRASNSAGQAEATFALTVEAVPDTPALTRNANGTVTLNSLTPAWVAQLTRNPDGTLTLTEAA